MSEWEQYCPICGRTIKATNRAEVEAGEHDGYVFVHDEIIHNDSDLEALRGGIQAAIYSLTCPVSGSVEKTAPMLAALLNKGESNG